MMETDDSQDFIWEILDEVVDNAIKRVYGEYLSRMTIPFTINEARKAIIHIIDVKQQQHTFTCSIRSIWFVHSWCAIFCLVAVRYQRESERSERDLVARPRARSVSHRQLGQGLRADRGRREHQRRCQRQV